MTRDDYKAIAGGVLFIYLMLCGVALAADQPIDCNLVRQYVAQHGKAKALAWAVREGYNWREIQMARKCLK